MNKDVLNELEEIKNQLDEMREKYEEIKLRYAYMDNYKLVAHILNKLNVDFIETTIEEMEKDQSVYIAEHGESGEIRVYKESKETFK